MSEPRNDVHERRLKIAAHGLTDVGLKRNHNEDSIEVCPRLGLYAVADGMGGHAAGEVASRTALETLREFLAHVQDGQDFTWPFGVNAEHSIPENFLLTAIQLANRKICQLSEENKELAGMGTTLAVIFAPAEELHIAHVGDSRIYRRRNGEFELLTSDHSWVNEQLQRQLITEEEARNHRWRNIITRALGNRLDLDIDLQTVDACPGDLYLICSDGLTGMVNDEAVEQLVNGQDEDLHGMCRVLIDAANEAGGQDNVSVVVCRIEGYLEPGEDPPDVELPDSPTDPLPRDEDAETQS